MIREEWETYRAAVIPADAPAVQLSECHMAFWAGAVAAVGLLTTISAQPDPHPGLAELAREIDAMAQLITADGGRVPQ